MTTTTDTQVMDIVVPDIGDAENVEVIEILVSVGDAVSVDDSLITLESDKASMEVPAVSAGVIKSLNIEIGASVSSGDIIGSLEAIDSGNADAADMTAADPGATPGPDSAAANDQAVAAEATPPAAPATESASTRAEGDGGDKRSARSPLSPTAHLVVDNKRKSHASPGVRRYARELGADLSLISGSGPKNRILKEDVKAFIKQSLENLGSNYAGGSAGAGAGAIPAIPEVDFTRFGEIERVELGRINKLSASNLHRAWLNVPMVTHHDEADVTEMEAFRKSLKARAKEGDAKVTGLAFHMKALVQTLKAFPKLNSSMAPDGQSLIYKKYFHIGIAVDTPNGLVVPVFRDVDKKSVTELAVEMADISSRARAKKLKPEELQGASMTISSLGGIGGTAFTPIVNPPEVAILGITRATMKPVWNGSEFTPRLMCPLDLSYDHRVVDGADAARFMVHYCSLVSDIRQLLL